MNILIDTSPIESVYSYRGIGTYTKELLNSLNNAQSNHTFQTTTQKGKTIDLVHYPFFDFYFLTLPLVKNKPTIVTIHDCIPLIFPKKYPPGIKGQAKYYTQRLSLIGTKAIITDSKASKNDIVTYLNQPPQKVFVVPLAATSNISPTDTITTSSVLKKYNLNHPFILYVGDINYSKNLPLLLKAFAHIKSSHQLVLVSRALSQDIPEAYQIHNLINSLGIKNRVQILTNVPSSGNSLSGLYSGADWYIQPSLYEGFGFPVLEAMKCQTPVISSYAGSLPEVYGQAALTFDPTSVDDLVNCLNKALSLNSSDLNNLINLSQKQLAKFSWDKTAQMTIKVYESVIKSL